MTTRNHEAVLRARLSNQRSAPLALRYPRTDYQPSSARDYYYSPRDEYSSPRHLVRDSSLRGHLLHTPHDALRTHHALHGDTDHELRAAQEWSDSHALRNTHALRDTHALRIAHEWPEERLSDDEEGALVRPIVLRPSSVSPPMRVYSRSRADAQAKIAQAQAKIAEATTVAKLVRQAYQRRRMREQLRYPPLQ